MRNNSGGVSITLPRSRWSSTRSCRRKENRTVGAQEQVETILVTTRGSVGKLALFNCSFETGLINAQMLILRSDGSTLDQKFLFNLLRSEKFQETIKQYSSGSAQPQIPIQDLRQIEISYPPLREQREIAAILSCYDNIIENNTRRIKILEEMAKLIYREWFVEFKAPGVKLRKATAEEKRVTGKDVFPEGWEVVALERVCQRITDGSHYSPKSIDQGYPMASVKDMHDWGVNAETCRKVSEDDYQNLVRNDCKPRLNDVLIAKDGSYLKHVFCVQEELDLVILSSIAILRPISDMPPSFLVVQLRDETVKSRLKGYVSGAALPRIILTEFRAFKILHPSKSILNSWSALVEPMFKECFTLTKASANLRQTRDLLLPKLVSGEIEA
jgi:type I restriction enzyme S subunit